MAWTNGSPSHTTKTQRRRIMARDSHQCQIKGEHCQGVAVDVDHIDNRRGPDYDEDHNLQAACQECHMAKTQREAAARRGKFRRKPMPSIGQAAQARRGQMTWGIPPATVPARGTHRA